MRRLLVLLVAALSALMMVAPATAASPVVKTGTITHEVRVDGRDKSITWTIPIHVDRLRGQPVPTDMVIYYTVTLPNGIVFQSTFTVYPGPFTIGFGFSDVEGADFSGVWTIHIDTITMAGGVYGGGDQDDTAVVP